MPTGIDRYIYMIPSEGFGALSVRNQKMEERSTMSMSVHAWYRRPIGRLEPRWLHQGPKVSPVFARSVLHCPVRLKGFHWMNGERGSQLRPAGGINKEEGEKKEEPLSPWFLSTPPGNTLFLDVFGMNHVETCAPPKPRFQVPEEGLLALTAF